MTTPTLRPLHWGEWGVWCHHSRRWLVTGLASDREAWLALLDIDHPYHWQVVVRKVPDPEFLCDWCEGDGCDQHGKRCENCGGTGEEPEIELDDEEDEDE